jgi:hypothetical protein
MNTADCSTQFVLISEGELADNLVKEFGNSTLSSKSFERLIGRAIKWFSIDDLILLSTYMRENTVMASEDLIVGNEFTIEIAKEFE